MNVYLRKFLLAVFFVVVFSPFLVLGLELFKPPIALKLQAFSAIIPTERTITLLLNSLGIALTVALSAVFLGVLAACVLWPKSQGQFIYLPWFILLWSCLPPYIHALSWIATGISFTGWLGAYWTQLMSLLPIALGLVLMGFLSIEPSLVEAGRLSSPDLNVLFRIILPLALPVIVTSIGLLFILSIIDYSIPSLFSFNVYPLELFAEYSSSNDASRVLLLSLPLLLATFIVILASQSVIRKTALSLSRCKLKEATKFIWPGWFVWLQRLALAILALEFFVPLARLLTYSGVYKNILLNFQAARGEINFSFWAALLTASLSIPLALPVAEKLKPAKKNNWLWWLMVTFPLCIPATLIGIGLIILCNQPFLGGLYGSIWMVPLALLSRFLPLAAIVLAVGIRRQDSLLIDAARVYQKGPFWGFCYVRLPMLIPSVFAGAGAVFILSLGELGATLLVAAPGKATLTMRIYNLMHYGASSEVASLSLIMILLVLKAACFAGAAWLCLRILLRCLN